MKKEKVFQLIRAAKSGAEVAEELLREFDGWGDGDLARALFPDGQPIEELRALLSDEELAALRASTPTSLFTPHRLCEAIWGVLADALAGGEAPLRALEPSAGMGAWIASAPEPLRARLRWSAIEPEPISFAVLRARCPGISALRARLEEVALPDEAFDLVIGNPPYGDVPVADGSAPDWATRNLHGYFLYRGLRALRPGGLLVYITSRYTLDSSRGQRLLAWARQQAELVALARLPNGGLDGTEVIADVLVFERIRREGRGWTVAKGIYPFPGLDRWNDVWLFEAVADAIRGYGNPGVAVFGEPAIGRGMYSDQEFILKADRAALAELPARLAEYLRKRLPAGGYAKLGQEDAQPTPVPVAAIAAKRDSTDSLGPAPKGKEVMWADVDAVYRAAKAVLAADAAGAPDAEEKRAALRQAYDDCVKTWGALSGTTVQRLLRGHPAAPFLAALDDSGKPAPIFERPVVRAEVAVQPRDAREALAICLARVGRVDPAWIAAQLGKNEAEVIAELRGAIFRDPDQGGAWVTAEEYLSGDVRYKLERATAAALADPAYAENIEALRAAQPKPIPRAEITPIFGAPWVGDDVINAFLGQVAGEGILQATYVASTGRWVVEVREKWRLRYATARIGTPFVEADALAEATLNGRAVVVTRKGPDGKTARDDAASLQAQAKQDELRQKWAEWVWADEARARELEARYNARFNRWRARVYDGSHLTLPGLASWFTPRKNQLDGAWRIISSNCALPAHKVGRGKTAMAIIAIAEMLRLGIAGRAMVVVPNHLVGQWEKTIRALYPALRVMSVGEGELSEKKRASFFTRVATHDAQVVVVAMSQFTRLPVSPKTEQAHLAREIARAERVLTDLRAIGAQLSVKQVEQVRARLKARFEELSRISRDSDAGATFEDLGIDVLVVDEAHLYKNLEFVTAKERVAGLPNARSQRAWDMFLKVRWLIGRGKRVAFLTGTPIANTMAEAWTVMRYLALDELERLGLDHFDAWANTYAQAVPSVELAPDGSGFRVVTRLSKWVNLPELAAMMRHVMDVPPDNNDPLPGTPALYGGKPVAVVLPPSRALRRYTAQLVERAERVRRGEVPPSEDNMLKITSDGRKAALDMRLVAALPKPPVTKLGAAARIIAEIYHASTPLRAAQLVFCDLGTPKARPERDLDEDEVEELLDGAESLANRVYDELARLLVARGVKADEIAFIHQAKTRAARDELFKRVNAGEIRVLIGSTEKMGTGMNAQERLIALHHLDAPWRPDQVEQRNGRILRPGNKLPEAFVFVYETAGSFDAYVWQTLHAKAGFIEQIMNPSITPRTAEELGDVVLTYAELKALASGDPAVQRRILLEAEVAKLRRVRASWEEARAKAQEALVRLPARLAALEDERTFLERALAEARAVLEGEGGCVLETPEGRQLADPKAIGAHLRGRAATAEELTQGNVIKPAGKLGPFALAVHTNLYRPEPFIVAELDGRRVTDEARVTETERGTFGSLVHALTDGLERQVARVARDLERLRGELAQAQAQAGPWPDEARLAEAERELAELGSPDESRAKARSLAAVVDTVLSSRRAVRAALARVRQVVAAVSGAPVEAAQDAQPVAEVTQPVAEAVQPVVEAAQPVAEVAQPAAAGVPRLTFGDLALLKREAPPTRRGRKAPRTSSEQLSLLELLYD